MGDRYSFFSKEVMDKFSAQHKEAFGEDTDVQKGGHPDSGNGMYSEKLSYKHWFEYNNKVRVAQNTVEQLPGTICILLIGGIYHPFWAQICSILYVFGRLVYLYGYTSKGPDGRLIGAIGGTAPIYALIVASLVSCVKNMA